MKLVWTHNAKGARLEALGANAAVKLLLEKYEAEKSSPSSRENPTRARKEKNYVTSIQRSASS